MCKCGCVISAACTCAAREGKVPHKHAVVIKAWADGAKIEYRNKLGGWEHTVTPCWNENSTYRIKPEEKSYGQVAYNAFVGDDGSSWMICQKKNPKWAAEWERAAEAVIAAYKERNAT